MAKLHGSLLLCVLVLFPCLLLGQTTSATMSGQVTDPTKATMAEASVTAVNNETGVRYVRLTDPSGLYLIPLLPPGEYRIQVEKQGFKTVVKPGVVLHVQDAVVINFEMAVGSASETINVESGLQGIETTSSTLSSLTSPVQMAELPLNGRNFTQLLTLAPGVQHVQSVGNQTYGRGDTYSVSGQRAEGQAFLLDGQSIMDNFDHGTGSGALGTALGVDSIAEFQTMTNTYSAQFGGDGAVLDAASRSGTNTFHGSAYEFLRNSALDARNYYDPLSGPPSFSRNQFGGTVGGPIKKDKAFFFANDENLRQSEGNTTIAFVPDANARQGIIDNTFVGVNPAIAPLLQLFPSTTAVSSTGIASCNKYRLK